jgi:hypothetical protein
MQLMFGFACTVDVITWLDVTFIYIVVKPPALSSLVRGFQVS